MCEKHYFEKYLNEHDEPLTFKDFSSDDWEIF